MKIEDFKQIKIVSPESQSESQLAESVVGEARDYLYSLLNQHGAILFRGFHLASASKFNKIAQSLLNQLLPYENQTTPRKKVGGNIYTSTEYPNNESIALHSENSYCDTYTKYILFGSLVVADKGGQTPIADNRAIYNFIPDDIRNMFEEKQLVYIRNYYPHLGLSWQEVFQENDKSKLEEYFEQHHINYRWKPDEGLYVDQVRPAVIKIDETSSKLWFNQAHIFHPAALADSVRQFLSATYSPDDMPQHCKFADGIPIENNMIAEINDAYDKATFSFDWQLGDFLLMDNRIMSHGRYPYDGTRKVLVAMSN